MHIEPGVVNETKMALSYAVAAGAAGLTIKYSIDTLRQSNSTAFVLRFTMAALLTVFFFEVLPKFPVGVSEVHFIFGSTLFLLFGAAPAAIGLAAGLAIQGLFLAPTDLPQYFMNASTLLFPLFAISWVAGRIISPNTAYVDCTYKQVLKLSASYQSGIVAWVAFWAFYGQGFGADNISEVTGFGLAYLSVIVIEPIVDVVLLAIAKMRQDMASSMLFTTRLTQSKS
jgi:ABC-type Co2+ transport system permease subunit